MLRTVPINGGKQCHRKETLFLSVYRPYSYWQQGNKSDLLSRKPTGFSITSMLINKILKLNKSKMKSTMKKLSIALALLVVSCNAVSAQNVSRFVINGVLKNVKPMPDKVFLIYPKYESKKVDSSDVVNGTYKFTGEIGNDAIPFTLAFGPEPEMMAARQHLDIQADLIIVKGETNVVSDGFMYNVTETGASAEADRQYKQLAEKSSRAMRDWLETAKSPFFLTRNSVRVQANKKYQQEAAYLPDAYYTFIKQHPTSPLTPLLANNLSSNRSVDKGRTDSLITILSSVNEKSTIRTEALTKLQTKSDQLAKEMVVSAGKPAPDFSQNDVNGNPVKLSSFRGKYVLIDFWASWCAPCRAENPNVVKAYAKYHDKNFEILGVSLDNESAKNAWNEAIKKDGLIWPQVSDLKGWKNEAAKLYAVTGIPQNFLIDPKGQIIATNLRGEALNKALEKYLN